MSTCISYEDVYGPSLVDQSDWTGGAVFIEPLEADGYYSFQVSRTSVGVVLGLSPNPEGEGFLNIAHGFLFSRGQFRVIEGGVQRGEWAPYNDVHVFHVLRSGTQVFYCRSTGNKDYGAEGFSDDVIYTSDLPSYGSVALDASSYATGDTIRSGSYSPLVLTVQAAGGFVVAGSVSENAPNSAEGGFQLLGYSTEHTYISAEGGFYLTGSTSEDAYNSAEGGFQLLGYSLEDAYNPAIGGFYLTGNASENVPNSAEGGFQLLGDSLEGARNAAIGNFYLAVTATGASPSGAAGGFVIHGVSSEDAYNFASGGFSLVGLSSNELRLGEFSAVGGFSVVGEAQALEYVESGATGWFMLPGKASEEPYGEAIGGFTLFGMSAVSRPPMQNYFDIAIAFSDTVEGVTKLTDSFTLAHRINLRACFPAQDYLVLESVAPVVVELFATLRHELALVADIAYIAFAKQADAIALNEQFTSAFTAAFVLASSFSAQSSVLASTEQTAALSDTLRTTDHLTFVARLLVASGLVVDDTLLGDPQRLLLMAERLHLTAQPASTAELVALLGDDIALNEAFVFLARLTLGDSLTLNSAFSAEDLARVYRLVETIVLADRHAATLETLVGLVEAAILVDSLDSAYRMTAGDSLALADTTVAQLLAVLAQLDTLQLIDTLASGFVFTARTEDALALTADPMATLTALLRHRDVLAFIGRLPLGDEDYQAWVLNSDSLGVTEYTNFPFNSLADTPKATYGLTATGLYELTGDDDDGVPIAALLRTGDIEFGTAQHKQVDSAYLYLTSSDTVVLKTISTYRGQRNEAWYRVDYREGADDGQTRRVRFGKGAIGTTWAFELTNIDGGDFDLRGAEVLPMKLQRRI